MSNIAVIKIRIAPKYEKEKRFTVESSDIELIAPSAGLLVISPAIIKP